MCEFNEGCIFYIHYYSKVKGIDSTIHKIINEEQAKEMANNPDYLPVRVDDSRTKTSTYHFIPLQAEVLKDPSIVQDFHLENIFKELKKSYLSGIHGEQFENFREALLDAGYKFAKLEIVRSK